MKLRFYSVMLLWRCYFSGKERNTALCISFMHSSEFCTVSAQYPLAVWVIRKSEKMLTAFFSNYRFLCFLINGKWFILLQNNQVWKTFTGFKLYSFCCIYFCKHSSYPGPLIIQLYSQIVKIHAWEGKKKYQWSMSITSNMTVCCKATEEEVFFKKQLG